MATVNGTAQRVHLKTLSPEQVNFFWTNGYLTIGKLLEDDEIEILRQEYDAAFDQARKGQATFRNLSVSDASTLEEKNEADSQMLQIMQMCERSIVFRQLLYHEKLLDLIEDILGPNIQLFHDQALYKPPHHGGPVHWHQDNGYWQCSPPNLVSAWITLDDVDQDNGAMQFLPGTHFQAVAHQREHDEDPLYDLGGQVDDSKAVVVPLPAGGVTLHHCQTLHYTAPNVTDRQRRAFAIHYMVPGTKSLRTGEYLPVSFSRPLLRMRA